MLLLTILTIIINMIMIMITKMIITMVIIVIMIINNNLYINGNNDNRTETISIPAPIPKRPNHTRHTPVHVRRVSPAEPLHFVLGAALEAHVVVEAVLLVLEVQLEERDHQSRVRRALEGDCEVEVVRVGRRVAWRADVAPVARDDFGFGRRGVWGRGREGDEGGGLRQGGLGERGREGDEGGERVMRAERGREREGDEGGERVMRAERGR